MHGEEFDHSGIHYERQKIVPIIYRQRKIKDHRLDFLVENAIVLEIKAVAVLETIFFAVVRSCMKVCNANDGLLINFASMPLTVKRVGREDSGRQRTTNSSPVPDFLIS